MNSALESLIMLFDFIHDQLLDSFARVTNLYFSTNYIYLIVFIMCVVLLIVKRNDNPNGYWLLGISTILILLVLYFPPLLQLFNFLPASDDMVFARLWLLCPVWIVIAYSCASNISDIKNNVIRYSSVVILVLILIISGNNIYSLNMLNEPQNIYKIRTESIEISDEVLRLNNGAPTSLFIIVPLYNDEENYINGGTVNRGIEQYTGDIRLTAFKLSDEDWNNYFLSDITPTNLDSEDWIGLFISQRYENSKAEFFALPTNDTVNSKLTDLGYEWLSDVAGYSIYRMN